MTPRAAASRRSRAIVVASIVLAAAVAAPATAQLRAGLGAHSLLRPAGLHAANQAQAGVALDPRWTEQGITTALAGSVIGLEESRDAGTGQYTGPSPPFALPLDAMKAWLNPTGLAAEPCLLPMLRAPTRATYGGEVHGLLRPMARCTFP